MQACQQVVDQMGSPVMQPSPAAGFVVVFEGGFSFTFFYFCDPIQQRGDHSQVCLTGQNVAYMDLIH